MGAGSNSTTIVCTTHSVEILSQLHSDNIKSLPEEDQCNGNIDTEYDTKITTIPPKEQEEIIETIASLPTHEDELKKLREIGSHKPILPSEIGTDFNFKREIVWWNSIGFIFLHILALIGCGIMICGICDIKTTIYCE